MTSEDIALALEERTIVGKGLNHLRGEGKIPAVIHDHGKPSVHVMGDQAVVAKVYAQAGKHHPVNLTIGGKKQLALIKDADFEPAKHRLRHVVFQAVKQNEKVTAEIPVVLLGEEIPAEKIGLLVLPQLDVVEVEALPRDLPDQLTVNAEVLAEVGDKLHVSDLVVPNGVTVLTDQELQLAIVEMPKDQIAEADAAAAELAAESGTVQPEAEAETESEAGEEE